MKDLSAFRHIVTKSVVTMAKTKTKKARTPGPLNICMRCEKKFPSRRALKLHSRAHLQALRELKMLEKGQIPIETKFGSEFKGRNKVIVA